MYKKLLIVFVAITILCLIIIITNLSSVFTINKLLIKNDFDITKVESFQLSQRSYNWYSSELTSFEVTDSQNLDYYISQISNIKLYKYKPLFSKTEYNFDYYNDVFLVTLKLAYENKQFIMTVHNGEVAFCNVLINNKGKFENHSFYINSFGDFYLNF